MLCPHCQVAFHSNPPLTRELGDDAEGHWFVETHKCPTCHKLIATLIQTAMPGKTELVRASARGDKRPPTKGTVTSHRLILPKGALRPPPPPEVPGEIAEDYKEACLVLSDSAKASAALGRRCLQAVLRRAASVESGRLVDEIQQVLDSGHLPSHLAQVLEVIRNIGNIASHPISSKTTGIIVDIEPGEAEWNLDVLEALFDFYYVQPERTRKKMEALNKKLRDAGMPELKAGQGNQGKRTVS